MAIAVLLAIVIIETNFYVTIRKQSELFLQKELSQRQENQINDLIFNLKDNVVIMSDDKHKRIKMKNSSFDSFFGQCAQEYVHIVNETDYDNENDYN
jgi:hypothetical protein